MKHSSKPVGRQTDSTSQSHNEVDKAQTTIDTINYSGHSQLTPINYSNHSEQYDAELVGKFKPSTHNERINSVN
jgi:hypothetical protein